MAPAIRSLAIRSMAPAASFAAPLPTLGSSAKSAAARRSRRRLRRNRTAHSDAPATATTPSAQRGDAKAWAERAAELPSKPGVAEDDLDAKIATVLGAC